MVVKGYEELKTLAIGIFKQMSSLYELSNQYNQSLTKRLIIGLKFNFFYKKRYQIKSQLRLKLFSNPQKLSHYFLSKIFVNVEIHCVRSH